MAARGKMQHCSHCGELGHKITRCPALGRGHITQAPHHSKQNLRPTQIWKDDTTTHSGTSKNGSVTTVHEVLMKQLHQPSPGYEPLEVDSKTSSKLIIDQDLRRHLENAGNRSQLQPTAFTDPELFHSVRNGKATPSDDYGSL